MATEILIPAPDDGLGNLANRLNHHQARADTQNEWALNFGVELLDHASDDDGLVDHLKGWCRASVHLDPGPVDRLVEVDLDVFAGSALDAPLAGPEPEPTERDVRYALDRTIQRRLEADNITFGEDCIKKSDQHGTSTALREEFEQCHTAPRATRCCLPPQ